MKTLALEQPRYGYRRLVVDTSISSARVIWELEAAIVEYGKPRRIRIDNGSEFASLRNFTIPITVFI